MDDVITLSSGSDVDSDVEIIGSFRGVIDDVDTLPLTELRVDVDAVKVPALYIDLTNPKWNLPDLKKRQRQNSTALTLVDLTETNIVNETKQDAENLPSEHRKSSPKDPTVCALQQDCGNLQPKQRRVDSQTQDQNHTDKAQHRKAIVKLRRLPFLDTHVAELKTSRCCVYLNKDCTQMSLHFSQEDNKSEALECIRNLMTTTSNEFTSTQLNARVSQDVRSPAADSPRSVIGGSVATIKDHSTHEDDRDGFNLSLLIPSQTSPSSFQHKAQGSLKGEVPCSKVDKLELEKAEFRQSYFNYHNPLSHRSPISHNLVSQVEPTPSSEHSLGENTSVKADVASNGSDLLHWNVPIERPLSTDDMDDESRAGTDRVDLGIDSPVSFLWQEGSDGDEVTKESRFDMDFREASEEDRQFVCPVTLRKMCEPAQAMLDEEDEGFGAPEVLCRQSLSLVYSTIDENYPEGTLELLSDLLQPGYYPPSDITSHLLRGILLNPQCSYHLCVQAFNLLMRAQRHHMADKTTVPWDWELLTSVTANQAHRERNQCEVKRMLLDYVVQTLEDDIKAKSSAPHHSIAKATLSCDQQFPQVRDVIKWLFTAIMKATEHGESRETARERDEQIRMVSIFQRMLSLALEVDRSPAINSAKLSQELFHMLISNNRLRAHRMLLLESLQSKLLRCKLLEHLLDYACPHKISLPMSLSLLLHFLKHCSLPPDPSDGTERWQRWGELVHLLWMFLLSYKRAKEGYLCNSVSEHRGRVGNLIYKPDDMVSKSAICEAVEAFLSRSQADLGQALPLHVEESLSYLQDHLLDVCQC